jgi:hypothetical protein
LQFFLPPVVLQVYQVGIKSEMVGFFHSFTWHGMTQRRLKPQLLSGNQFVGMMMSAVWLCIRLAININTKSNTAGVGERGRLILIEPQFHNKPQKLKAQLPVIIQSAWALLPVISHGYFRVLHVLNHSYLKQSYLHRATVT